MPLAVLVALVDVAMLVALHRPLGVPAPVGNVAVPVREVVPPPAKVASRPPDRETALAGPGPTAPAPAPPALPPPPAVVPLAATPRPGAPDCEFGFVSAVVTSGDSDDFAVIVDERKEPHVYGVGQTVAGSTITHIGRYAVWLEGPSTRCQMRLANNSVSQRIRPIKVTTPRRPATTARQKAAERRRKAAERRRQVLARRRAARKR